MKLMMSIGAAAMLASLAACGKEAANKPASESKAPSTAEHSATGTVDSLSGNEVKIAHEPIDSIGWPAMTMSFTAKDPAQVQSLKAGDRVTFSFVKSDDGSTLTTIAKQ